MLHYMAGVEGEGGEGGDLMGCVVRPGFEIYSPNVSIIAHEYARIHSVKFWEFLQLTFGSAHLYNELQNLTIQRVQHLFGFPEAVEEHQITPRFLTSHMHVYGPGRKRTLESFFAHTGLDVERKIQLVPKWCS